MLTVEFLSLPSKPTKFSHSFEDVADNNPSFNFLRDVSFSIGAIVDDTEPTPNGHAN